VPDQWEFYNLKSDPNEMTNLVVYDNAEPTVIAEDRLPPGLGMTRQEVQETARKLHRELAEKEAELLSPYPSAYPTAGASAAA
jgi:hypothetical protein